MYLVATVSQDQAKAIVSSLLAVADAGAADPTEDEMQAIAEIQNLFLESGFDLDALPKQIPDNITEVLNSDELRDETIRLAFLIPLVSGDLETEKFELVGELASRLDESHELLHEIHQLEKKEYKRWTVEAMRRVVKPAGGRGMLGSTLGIAETKLGIHIDPEIEQRYKSLEALEAGTAGRALWDYYDQNGFGFPGVKGGLDYASTSHHDIRHVLGGYDTSISGEVLVSAFESGAAQEGGLDWAALTLAQFQDGIMVLPGIDAFKSMVQSPAYFEAYRRGAGSNRNLLTVDWDIWEYMDKPLSEVRKTYGIPTEGAKVEATGPWAPTKAERLQQSENRTKKAKHEAIK